MSQVIIKKASYDNPEINSVLKPLGGMENFVKKGDKVLLKVNLLSAKEPEKAVTTHPDFIRAVAKAVRKAGGKPLIGDSPAGLFSKRALKKVYKRSGLEELAKEDHQADNHPSKSRDHQPPSSYPSDQTDNDPSQQPSRNDKDAAHSGLGHPHCGGRVKAVRDHDEYQGCDKIHHHRRNKARNPDFYPPATATHAIRRVIRPQRFAATPGNTHTHLLIRSLPSPTTEYLATTKHSQSGFTPIPPKRSAH